MKTANFLGGALICLGIAFLYPGIIAWAQTAGSIPILIEQKIVSIDLKPENQGGIDWDLLKLYLKDQKSTMGLFPLDARARNRLEFKAMQKNVPPGKEQNTDFENVEKTRVGDFNYGIIWEDMRKPAQTGEDLHFGALFIYEFKPVMDFLRTLGETKVLFSRKWITENGQQSMISSVPEYSPTAGKAGGPASSVLPEFWEGARLTIKPEVIENNRIAFHFDSEIATNYYVDPAQNPDLPTIERGGKQQARLWRIFRLNTKGLVESGETAVFEDIRDGKGVIIFLTASILEAHRKVLGD